MFYIAFVPEGKKLMRTKYTIDVVISRNKKLEKEKNKKDKEEQKIVYLEKGQMGRYSVYNRFFEISESKIRICNVEGRLIYELDFKEPLLLEVDEKGNVVQVKEEFRLPEE